jgi:fructose-1,6-bisphosphatase/inositol monophosphatase family enzyme|tara:strand:- start:383 stop:1060 length:678 start_codon:yes stop_codon:yes gene_type:complete
MKNFYTQLKKIIDHSIKDKNYLYLKKDNSMLTKNDIDIQDKIILLVQKFFPDIKQFICEEKFDKSKFKKIDFNKSFAIIDPIDGTENFYAENKMFGTMVSVNSKLLKKKLDIIYIPLYGILITRDNILSIHRKSSKINQLVLLSTKCLGHKFKGSKYRMYGSSAFSFYKFIVGEANEFIYCDGAKIWDYFTGLRLSRLINCKLSTNNKNWFLKPNYKLKFKLQWN